MIKNWIHKQRILGSGFTKAEYQLYEFDKLENPDDAMRYMSHRQNHGIYRPALFSGNQQYFLDDKWITQVFFSSLNIPAPKTYGLFHPSFGVTISGKPYKNSVHIAESIAHETPCRLVFKPRGGRKGQSVIIADATENNGSIYISVGGKKQTIDEFISSLPQDAHSHYDGCYHGWLVQACITQHEFLCHLNSDSVNSMRIVTHIDSREDIQIHFSMLRVGRTGSNVDNWDKGGLSIGIDPHTGILGRGISQAAYGGSWTTEHPDSKVHFEGLQIPEWESILEICRRGASLFSGVRSIGWDIALTPTGPLIIEGNADWGLPSVQVHTRGYLSEEVRCELDKFGAHFPKRARPITLALLALLVYQWRRSKGPHILHLLSKRIINLVRVV